MVVYNIFKIISLVKKCTVKIIGKVSYFRQKSKYDAEIRVYKKTYTPVYKFKYKNKKYQISNNKFLSSAPKIVEKDYKIRINPNNPYIFIDKVYLISRLIVVGYGFLIIGLGIFMLFKLKM